MNVKKILNNIQEKIALDKFKFEVKKNKRNKRRILIATSVVVVFAGLLYHNAKNKDENYI